MQLRIDKEKENEILLEIKGETVSFANLIRSELWNDKSVVEAACMKEHPYLAEPKIFVKVDKGSPITALDKAATRITDQAIEFREEFKRSLKK